ncbi:MAG: glycoside hydrolase family protein [Alphaproteobacteria bacterium]|nr:glycoside hydrolase family protein [Alphaproteobacteria bacterium]
MITAITDNFKNRLCRHEGIMLKPYRCSSGRLTIGIGRNLEDTGLSKSEALFLLENDLRRVELECSHAFSWFDALDDVRKRVLIEMAFNMGITGLMTFRHMLKAIQKKDYVNASKEMINSLWAKQVKTRAYRLAHIMETGEEI